MPSSSVSTHCGVCCLAGGKQIIYCPLLTVGMGGLAPHLGVCMCERDSGRLVPASLLPLD